MNLFLKTGVFAIVLSVLFSSKALSQDRRPRSEPYIWKNVQMVGGGFVDGIIFHPSVKGVRYAQGYWRRVKTHFDS